VSAAIVVHSPTVIHPVIASVVGVQELVIALYLQSL